jgi:hypothetical protein
LLLPSETEAREKRRRSFLRWPPLVILGLAAGLSAVSALSLYIAASQGWTLYYGDAMAHLNIARRIVDSRTPGLDQIGTVWLPLPHLLTVPLVGIDALWRNGLAGAIPAALCFVLAGLFLAGIAARVFQSNVAGFTAAAAFAFNPNLLYLQATPMTEAVFFAAFAASLTRYEGWFLLPFGAAGVFLTAQSRRWQAVAVFCLIAGAGPVSWLAHNWWHYRNPLEFYNSPYSAKGIYQRALDAGMARYPGDGEWGKAVQYFLRASRLAIGPGLTAAGLAGLGVAVFRRSYLPVAFLALAPAFYILSMYSSGTPIFVPDLWPFSYYNTRYGLAALPLLAFGAGALATLAKPRWRPAAGAVCVLAALLPWALKPSPEAWVCWKESQVNSEARRAWTGQAADFLRSHRRPSEGVFTSFGDLTGIFLEAGIPLRYTLHEGNSPHWQAAVNRPNLFLHETWAVAFSGDPVTRSLLKFEREGARYQVVERVFVNDGPVVEIYRLAR